MTQKMWIYVKRRRKYLFFIVAALLTFIVGLATIATTDDYGDDYLTATYIVADGALVHGGIEQLNDRDFFSFKALANEKYLICTGPLSDNMDTVIYLFEPDGQTVLEINDNFGDGPGSRLLWSAPADGMYFIMVRHTQADGIGQYTLSVEVFRIQKMIERAGSGDIVLVPPGVYQEDLVIAKSITLRGEGGSPEETRIVGIDSEEAVISIGSDEDIEVNVQNITVANAQMECIRTHVGIQIIGSAIVTIENAEIINPANYWSGMFGIHISGCAQVNLENCQIANYGENALVVTELANVHLNSCHIHHSTKIGIAVSNSAQVIATNCEIYSNGIAIAAGEGSPKLTLSNCELYRNGGQAYVLLVEDLAEITVNGCSFYGNYESGIFVTGEAQAVITDSRMTSTGISVAGSAQAIITSCSIAPGYHQGVDIREEALVTINDVDLSDNELTVRNYSTVTVTNCTIGVLRVSDSSQVTVIGCAISGSEDNGVTVSGEGTVATFEDCTISDHEDWGVCICGSAQVTLSHCTISSNETGVMIYYSDPRVRILDSVISNNGLGINATISNNIVECRGNTFVNNHDGNCNYAAAQKCQ